ncbi:hypothetical protein [Streptacidiphilus jiangxiensis]|uniref:Uncharacterized protein n=1 Tax=Streptacidiphilus jiangxiensis TaxID=235985 RepID=A0A1H8A970_STRJI|nr:hypothetical protein [Streptacidiphilus jiangxiensis]SEM67230.1 hypothetical protein SAMN05414137_14224 [Streptacidiphilus jiangxiensis]
MAGVHPAAARFEGEREVIVSAYAQGLADAGSPLLQPGRWSRVRRQADAILRECAAGLRDESVAFSDADLVTVELMGARRALDGVPLRESLRAARILWLATAPALRRAVADLPEPEAEDLLRHAAEVFRRSACTRLYIGAAGYGDTELRELLREAESPDADSGTDRSGRVVPTQRDRDTRIPVGGAHHRIARELGIPESAVRSTLRAAIRRAGEADRRVD